MRTDPSQRVRTGTWLILAVLAFALSGCFQNAGEAIVPTPVNLTAIAPKSPTPFVTPISTAGFVAPPTETPVVGEPANPTETPVENAQPTLESTAIITPTELSSPALTTPTEQPAQLPPTPTALPTEGPCTHTVQPGEWLMSIARKYGITLDQLLAVNPSNAANPNKILQPGDVLNIPNCGKPPTPTSVPATNPPAAQAQPTALPSENPSGLATPIPPTTRTYTVAPGDTLGLIARKFGTTVQAIKEANGLTTDFLNIGQQLKIPQ